MSFDLKRLACAALVLGSAAPLNAQALDHVLNRVPSGRTIQVRTRDQGRVEATLLRLEDNSLRLERAGLPDIPVASIDSVWVRGHATATGAIVGGAALAAVFALIMSTACEPGADCSGVEVPAAAAVGFAGGALAGALIGAATPSFWKLRYAKQGLSVGVQWNRQQPPGLTLTYRF